VEALDEASLALMNLPLRAARQIGSYYHSLAIYRKGRKEEADALLERIADAAPITYRARALQSLGANCHVNGQLDEALRFQLQALRVASDRNAQGLQTTLIARLEISIIKSLYGDHNRALSDLEGLGPLVSLIAKHHPFYFYAYCNELAVGLGEFGRIDEAQATLDIALASPYASAYPNWAETRQELEAKRTSATPSVVPVRQTAEGIPASRTEPQHCQKPDRVLAFCRLIIEGTALQITLILTAGFNAIADRPTGIDILDQLGRCFRARAPPPQH
jgi:tetratricopeptide (TPR) repeat protein